MRAPTKIPNTIAIHKTDEDKIKVMIAAEDKTVNKINTPRAVQRLASKP